MKQVISGVHSIVPGRSATVDAVVLGAGVVGVTTAYALARRGLSVALVDSKPGPGLVTSFANGAQLSYAYSDTLASSSLWSKLPWMALGIDRMMQVKWSLDPDLFRWGMQFLANCNSTSQREGTLATLTLALESQVALHDLLARHPLSFGFSKAGKMHLYFDRSDLLSAGQGVALKRAHGAVQEVLSAKEAAAVEPALEGMKDLAGAVFSPHDEVGDPHKFCVELVQVLEREYGVKTFFGMTARTAEFATDRVTMLGTGGETICGRSLVVALGNGAVPFLKPLGVRVPVMPMKGYSFTAPLGANAPKVSLTDTARKLVFCRLSGMIRVAGGAELGNRDGQVDKSRLGLLVEAAKSSLADAADYSNIESGWAGLRPMTPSSLPIIVQPRERLVLNVGHGMLGWTLAMGAAERAAALVLKDERKNAMKENAL
ncbi:MAG TPA: FAD-dependent oxidoreductase [Rhizomicrobium sp.]